MSRGPAVPPDGKYGWPYLHTGLDVAEAGPRRNMKNTKRVMSYIIIGVFVIIAAAILFVVLSPSYEARIVRSESMKPAIQMGDVVVMGPVKDIGDIKTGMVISFMRSEDMIAHRVVSVEGDDIQTAGDATGDPDPWLVPFSDVSGVYLFKVPYLGYVAKFSRTPIGWGVLVILPGTLLMGYLVWDMFRKSGRNKAKQPKGGRAVAVKATASHNPGRTNSARQATPRNHQATTRGAKPRRANNRKYHAI